jgi:hypothetical protein
LPIFDLKNVKTLYHPHTLQIYLRQIIFFPPKLKMKLKELHFADVAEIQEAVTDELKKVHKERNFWQVLKNSTTA